MREREKQSRVCYTAQAMETIRRLNGKTFAPALLAAVFLWICLFSGLSAIGLAGPDETRYAWIARHMAETGNWVTPILYGKPWFEKPILYYWAAAIGFKLIHSPEWAARLPSSLAALAAALAIAWLGWRRYGASTAWAVLIILPSCAGMIGFSRAAAPDMLFAASLAMAFVRATAVARIDCASPSGAEPSPRSDWRTLIFLGVWLGVATLAKGPAAIILAGGSVALWASLTRNWKNSFRMLHPLAIGSFAIVALPWYIVCGLRNPAFFRVFVLHHNFGRYLTPEFHHPQPIWFFIPILFLGLLPWTALLGGAALDGLRIWREKTFANSLGLFAACWAIFPLIFFSFSQSKLPGYILPAIPPLALLLARSYVRAAEQASHVARWIGIATGILWIGIAAAARPLIHRLPAGTLTHDEVHRLMTHVLLIGIAAGIAIIVLSALRRFIATAVICGMFVAGMTEFATRTVLAKIDPYVSERALAKIVPRPLPTSPAEVPLIGVTRSCEFGVRFYRPELEFVRWGSQNAADNANSFSGYALVGPEGEKLLTGTRLERHLVRSYSPACQIEFLSPMIVGH